MSGADDELRLYRAVLETSGELVWSMDREGRWSSLNTPAARRIYGREPHELLGRPFIEVVPRELRERDSAVFRRVLEGEPVFDHETRHLRSDGTPVDLSFSALPLKDGAGRLVGAGGTARDITAAREQVARFLAYHDALTGLPNRRLLDDRLAQAIHLAQRGDRGLAVMLIDLDDFRQVNDALGHGAGDAVLREVAQRLAACVRRADTLARHGGDEFVVVLSDVKGEAGCALVAEKLLRSLAASFRVGARPVTLAASIGISLFPGDAGDGDALLRNADAALNAARQRGRNQYRFYGR